MKSLRAKSLAEDHLQVGTVLHFNDIVGSGWIQRDSDNVLVYADYRYVKRYGYRIVSEGQKVLMEVVLEKRGLVARKIYPVEIYTMNSERESLRA